MPVVDTTITDDGLKIEKLADGSTIRKCVSETCIEKHTTDSPMSHDCQCGECSTTRLSKSDSDDTLDPQAVEILDQELPDKIFEAVMEHFAEEKVEDVDEDHTEETEPLDDAPESGEDIGKAMMDDLYDGTPPDTDESTQALLSKSNGQYSELDTPEHYAKFLVENDTIEHGEFDLEKNDETTTPLDNFYRSQGESP